MALIVSPRSFAAEQAYKPACTRATRCKTKERVEIIMPQETF